MFERTKATTKAAADKAKDSFGTDSPETTESASGPSLMEDTRAQSGGAQTAVNLVVGLMVGGLIAAFLLPVAIEEIVGVETTDWSSGASSLWQILDIIIVLAVFLFFIGLALREV